MKITSYVGLLALAKFIANVIHCSYESQCPEWPVPETVRTVTGRHNDVCFVVIYRDVLWDVANATCERHGWRLFRIQNHQEANFYQNFLTERKRDSVGCFWMGLTDREKEGEYRWSDGSIAGFVLVEHDYLSFLSKYFYDCVVYCKILFEERYIWREKPCKDGMWDFICDYEIKQPKKIETTVSEIKKKEKGNTRSRRKRSEPEKRFERFSELNKRRLDDKSIRSVKAWSVTVCARECRFSDPECEVFNFHGPTFTCVLFSKRSVVEGQKTAEDGWEIWRVM